MDVAAMVAVAHRRLRLRRLLVAIERRPELLDERDPMALTIKKPMELAGLSSRLTRATVQETAIGDLGKRYDAVMDRIDEVTAAHKQHVGDMEQYEDALRKKIEGMLGSNGGDPLSDGQDGQSSESGQVINGVKAS